MVWEKAEGSKPPMEFDPEEEKKIDKKVLMTEKESFANEIKTGISKDKPDPVQKPNEVIFDSHRGFKK